MVRDSIAYGDGMNLYEYARSGPTLTLDPDGLRSLAQDKSEYEKCADRVKDLHAKALKEGKKPPAVETAIEDRCAGLTGDPTKDRKNWKEGLPDCPKTASAAKKAGWDSEGYNKYHPGSIECFRKKGDGTDPKFPNKGQQCCYDKEAKLITHGPGAGTPDKSSPAAGIGAKITITHKGLDFDPFIDLKWDWLLYEEFGFTPNRPKDCPENWGGYDPKTGNYKYKGPDELSEEEKKKYEQLKNQ